MKKNSNRFVEMKATTIEAKANVTNPKGTGISQGLDYQAVVGLDVGDRKIHYCVLDPGGELAVEGARRTRKHRCGSNLKEKPECESRWKQVRIHPGSVGY